MSRQINFYILPEDLKDIEIFFKKEDILFVSDPVRKENEILADSISNPHSTSATFRYYLVHQSNLSKIKLKWIEKQSYFLVDIYESLAVEFDQSYFISNGQHNELRGA